MTQSEKQELEGRIMAYEISDNIECTCRKAHGVILTANEIRINFKFNKILYGDDFEIRLEQALVEKFREALMVTLDGAIAEAVINKGRS